MGEERSEISAALRDLHAAGCELIGDIFQAGFAVGVIAVVLVLALVGFAIAKLR